MNSVLLGLTLVVSSASAAPGDTLRERYDALLKEYDAMMKGWDAQFADVRVGSTERLIERYQAWPAWTYLARFHVLAEEDPADPAAGDALFWVFDIGRAVGVHDSEYIPALERCLELLTAGPFLKDPRMKQVFRFTLDRPSPTTERFLRLIVKKDLGRAVHAQALLALGRLLKDKAVLARDPWFAKPGLTPWEAFIASKVDPKVREYLNQADPEASKAEAEMLVNTVIKDYADVVYLKRTQPGLPDVTLGDLARTVLTEIQALVILAVGKPAPEIEGTDLGGKPLTLRDFRGKVVVLTFWKSTSRASLDLMPRLRALAERHKGKPLVLLGVNSDDDRETARAATARERMTWPSWYDEPPKSSIGSQWSAGVLPTVYVIDAKGVLRHKGRGEKDEPEKTVDALVMGVPTDSNVEAAK